MRCFPALACFALLATSCDDGGEKVSTLVDPYSEEAFSAWLARGNEAIRKTEFADFEQFLAGAGVADVLPVWQLLRTDANYASRCDVEAFAMPPRNKWHAMIPTLRIIRDEVVPVVGRVEVNSAWRSDELNACISGASRSKHLAFSAVDLIAPDRSDKREMFFDLCAMHRKVGQQTKIGLGAYSDPSNPRRNGKGRFHIDASGHRTWGYDYTRKSSGCLLMDQEARL